MDPNQTLGTPQSRIEDVDLTRSDSRSETLPFGERCTDGTVETTQMQQTPLTGTSAQYRVSSHDRAPISDRTSIPDRTGALVWNRPRERQSIDDPTRASGNGLDVNR